MYFFHAESNGGIYFDLSIKTKELYTIFHNPSSRDIARSAPPSGENLNFFMKLCGLLYLFRITHNPKNIDTNFGDYVPPNNHLNKGIWIRPGLIFTQL